MLRRLAIGFALSLGLLSLQADSTYRDFDQPPHNYWSRPLKDRFTGIKEQLESGQLNLSGATEKEFLTNLLRTLNVPVSSQIMVFSTTSLQLRFITPSNPRALYFTDDLYVGYIPGGRIEIVSIDPELGGIYYIFDVPRGGQPARVERSNRCMNCHSGDDTGFVPGLLAKSVVPGPTGGSLDAFRIGLSGHGIPFDQRFGGWYVTGKSGITNHWGNIIGRLSAGVLDKTSVPPGSRFDFARYPAKTSDILPHLLHEHQVGFVNRTVEAHYRTRTLVSSSKGSLDAAAREELDQQAGALARYILFADEVALPAAGVEGDPAYKTDFLKEAKRTRQGQSLRDFDLHTRLFRYRCSYMIYSSVFGGLPKELKDRVFSRMQMALDLRRPDPEYAYLSSTEKAAIRSILQETLSGLPKDW